jgi:D-amino peptidase
MKTVSWVLVLIVAAIVVTPARSAQATSDGKLKVYISVDMEGVAGVVSGDQLGPEGFEYERFRQFMTAEANAAIRAALEAGATEIVVSDSHGNGENLLIEQLPKEVTVVRSWPRPLGMMEGIDASFDAVAFVGYHAGTHNPQGVRAHTISSARFADVRLNGIAVSEATMNAAIAGHFNVPVIMVSGDDIAVAETTATLGGIEGAVVKWALSFHSARSLTPAKAQELIHEKMASALARRGEFKPYKLATPVRLDLRFKAYRPSEILSYLRIVERTDAHSIRFVGKDLIEVSRFLEFVTNYESDLQP